MIRYDSISIRYNKTPNERISRKYCSDMDFAIIKYVSITDVNNHKSRISLLSTSGPVLLNIFEAGICEMAERRQKVIRYDSISIRYDKIPNERISRKYHPDIDLEIIKYVSITDVNYHKSRTSL